MSVKLATDFPRVIRYELNSRTMYGSQLAKNYVSINGWDYPATAEISEETETSVTYNVKVEELGVSFDVVYTVLENNVLDMRIKNIADDSFTVYTIGFPEQPLISANSSQSGAKLDASMGASDVHLDLTANRADKVLNTVCTIPVITTDELSTSMENNVLNNLSEFTYRSFDMEDGTTTTVSGILNSFIRDLTVQECMRMRSCTARLYLQRIQTKTESWIGRMEQMPSRQL